MREVNITDPSWTIQDGDLVGAEHTQSGDQVTAANVSYSYARV
ncbi:MAG: hypothetical protein ACRDP6_04065 [Actinoallomurus sp.]